MTDPIAFHFDFSSPYGYFASLEIDELAARHGREVAWKPMLLGPAFKASGNQLLIEQPLKGAYSRHDWQRVARLKGYPYRFPSRFPLATLAAARAFWWLDAQDPALAKRFARAIFHAYFAEDVDVTPAEAVAKVGERVGVAAADLLAAVAEPAWKRKCRDETDAAIAAGVFGSPFIMVDGEPFWGWDRLPMVAEWLERGGG